MEHAGSSAASNRQGPQRDLTRIVGRTPHQSFAELPLTGSRASTTIRLGGIGPLRPRRSREASMIQTAAREGRRNAPDPDVDWARVVATLALSRALDAIEEERLVPEQEGALPVLRARPRHGAGPARPAAHPPPRRRLRLLPLAAAAARARRRARGRARLGDGPRRRLFATAATSASSSTIPNPDGASALPMCGGVGAQYTPTAGWAQAIDYHRERARRPSRTTARSRSCSAATPRSRPTASGRR